MWYKSSRRVDEEWLKSVCVGYLFCLRFQKVVVACMAFEFVAIRVFYSFRVRERPLVGGRGFGGR